MSYEENTATPPAYDGSNYLHDLLGIDPSYQRRMDAAILREHALQDKALLGTLSPAEQQELVCLEQESEELAAILTAELLEKSPRNEWGDLLLPTAGRQLVTSEQVYKMLHEE